MSNNSTLGIKFPEYQDTLTTVAELRAYNTARVNAGDTIQVTGLNFFNDQLGGDYVWDPLNTTTPDNNTVVAPMSGDGRWMKIVAAASGVVVDSLGDSTAVAPSQKATSVGLSTKVGITDLGADAGASIVGIKGPLPLEVRRSAYLNMIEVKRVQRWGVDISNTPAGNRQALQNAVNSGDKAELVFPDGDIKIDDLINVNAGKMIFMKGQGSGVSRLVQTNLTKGGIWFNIGYAQGGGIDGLSITSDVAGGARGSSGIGIQVTNANDQFMCRDFEVTSFDKCVRVDSSYQPSFKDFRLLYFADYGIFLSPYTVAGSDTAGTRWSNAKISNFGYTGPNPENSTGILIHQGSGEFFDTIDIQQVGIPVLVSPPAGSFARFLKFKTVLADTGYYEGWLIDGSNAPTFNIRMIDCWASGSGGGAARPAGSVRGQGLVTRGSQLDDVTWIGGELRDNDCGGWRHEGGKNVRISECSIIRNSRRLSFDNQYPGVAIAANVSDWALTNNRIGNFSQGVFAVNQAEAVVIEAGNSSGFMIANNNLSNPGPGKAVIANGTSSLNYSIVNNLPLQTPAVNYNRGTVYSGSSVGTVPANSVRYLAQGGQQAQENDSLIVVADPGFVRQFIAQVDAAPGASQSFNYVVRLNGTNTVMSGSISGTGSFQVILKNGFTVSAGDSISIQVSTSSTAALARHRWSLAVDA